MAMQRCKNCHRMSGSHLEFCHSCGALLKNTFRHRFARWTFRYVFAPILLISVLWSILCILLAAGGTAPKRQGESDDKSSSRSDFSSPSPGLSPKEIREQFSAWDGSHIKLEREIKRQLKDRNSYEHIETNFTEFGDHLLVKTQYRAKNSFGATVIDSLTAEVDRNGNIIRTFE